MTDPAALRAAVPQLEGRLGPTDLLIASAGIGRETPADDFRAEDFADIIQRQPDRRREQHRRRAAGYARAAPRPPGRAVQPGVVSRPAAHGRLLASKAGVNALMDALRVELKSSGIV